MATIPGPGHNLPPDPIVALRGAVEELVRVSDTWIKDVPVLTTEEQATRLEDLLAKLRKQWKDADEQRKAEKKPHDDAAQAVQDRYNPLLLMLEKAGEALKPLRSAWLQEQQRKLDEERNRLAREAADKQKAAEAAQAKVDGQIADKAPVPMVDVESSAMLKVGYDAPKRQLYILFPNSLRRYDNVPAQVHADLMAAESKGAFYGKVIKGKFDAVMIAAATVGAQVAAEQAQQDAAAASAAASTAMSAKAQVRGDFSRRATGLRTSWFAEVTDWDAAIMHYKNDTELRQLVQKLANADARKIKDTGMSIPGIVIKSKQE